MASTIVIQDLINERIGEASGRKLLRKKKPAFPLEFPHRRALGRILTQRGTSLLPQSGAIRYEPLQPGGPDRLFAETHTVFGKRHPTFTGHFPKIPVVKNNDFTELVGQTVSLLLALLDPRNKRRLVGTFTEAHSLFFGNVRPGQLVICRAWLTTDPAVTGSKDSPNFIISGTAAGEVEIGALALDGTATGKKVAVVRTLSYEVQPRELLDKEPPA